MSNRTPLRPARAQLALCVWGLAALAGCASHPRPFVTEDTAKGPTPLVQVQPGIYRIPAPNPDAVLDLARQPDVRVLVMGDVEPNKISDAHMTALRDWITGGGVLWVEGRSVEEGALKLILPVKSDGFSFHKTTSGDRGGELVVRDASSRLLIHDSPLTQGVKQLYLYPRYRFDGTPGLEPLVEMTDTEGNHGVVIGDVKVGRGLVVLDGTAREGRMLIGKIKGFSPEHPNAVEANGGWDSYDWNRLVANSRNWSSPAMDTGTGSAEPSPR